MDKSQKERNGYKKTKTYAVQNNGGQSARAELSSRKRANTWLSIALCIACALLIATTILWLVNMNRNKKMETLVENVYQRNFYDLIDNVNNAEVKLAKVLASDYDAYAKNLLSEISKNANSASYNLSNLPISLNGIDETKKFINQVGGYAGSLAKKLEKGIILTNAELDTLQDIHYSMVLLKDNLAKFNDDVVRGGYNIFKDGNLTDGDYNGFTLKIQGVKTSDVEYPTMIYDGPFSDGEFNKEIKGLNAEEITVQQAKDTIKQIYKQVKDQDIIYLAETNGKFKTFDFSVKLKEQISMYVQVTKNGGKILTVSGYGDKSATNLGLKDAIKKAKQIANEQTGTTFDCVWSDIVGSDAYINLAPVVSGVIIYPDLIKAKIDLASGELVGYSATSYYTNHTNRTLQSASYSRESANNKIPNGFNVEMCRLCLAPLDYGQETLCYEYKCTNNGNTYYIYVNAKTGITENILKVVETTDGNKLL